MKKIVCAFSIIIILSFVCIFTFAFDWPSDDGKYDYGFGTKRDGFLRGVEYSKTEKDICASTDGEVLISVSKPVLPGSYPVVGGTMVALSHLSEISTIYTGMNADSVSTYLKNVRAGDVIGKSSNDPKKENGVVVYVFDQKEKRYINPLIVMQNINDTVSPVIRSVSLIRDKEKISIEQNKYVAQGSYIISVDAGDMSPTGIYNAPYEVKLFIDGEEYAHSVYDVAWAKDGKSLLFTSGSFPEKSYLAEDGKMQFGPYILAKGKVMLILVVSDYSGNKREQTYVINVQ